MAELRRVLISPQRLAGCGQDVELTSDERHYLEKVLRLRPGSPFAIVDGQGGLHQAELRSNGWAQQGACMEQQPPQQLELVLLMGLIRRDFEVVVRMACELGVDQLRPLQAQRSVVESKGQRPQRWQSQLQEACEQSERLWLPQLHPVSSAIDGLSQAKAAGELRCIGVTREAGVPLLAEVLGAASPSRRWQLACGPEGGWTSDERQAAAAHGWQPVSLGPNILRASTAAISGLAVMQHQRQRLSATNSQPFL
jgi:16S rRNA (uracil1498-N3)-methyltransferase